MSKTKRTFATIGAAALLLIPAVPAGAAETMETCHPPRYDTVACVCRIVLTVLTKVTGDPWYCANR